MKQIDKFEVTVDDGDWRWLAGDDEDVLAVVDGDDDDALAVITAEFGYSSDMQWW